MMLEVEEWIRAWAREEGNLVQIDEQFWVPFDLIFLIMRVKEFEEK